MIPEYWNEGVDSCYEWHLLLTHRQWPIDAETGGGVILNIASDLGVMPPDQRLYRKEGVPEDMQKCQTYHILCC